MNKYCTTIFLTTFLLMSFSIKADGNRWYDASQASQGADIFQQQCASCHGRDAEANSGWQQASGEAAAPPLNGSAHAWHHSLKQLRKTIQMGSIQLGGAMPGFSEKLAESEIDRAIAFFQSKWPNKTYNDWATRFKVAGKTSEAPDVTTLLRQRLGTSDMAPAIETDIKGVYQTQFGDKFAYLIEGGRYVFIGDLIDLKLSRNLTEISRREVVKNVISSVPLSESIVFPATGKELTVLNVFTDTSCGYCQKLHTEVGFLQKAGISVRYFPFPRGGNRGPGYQDLKKVWCAEDKLQAMDIAKGVNSGKLDDGDCAEADIVDKGYKLGQKIGITGTPALFSSNGTKFNGYVPHKELIPRLLSEL
ncbi:MAG: thioredoxin fold domain-containing protein [Gammaproteobacteria bacterium]|nr:thioredoxin fold domain-containing protein [Gammaproteobacteria bacterium]